MNNNVENFRKTVEGFRSSFKLAPDKEKNKLTLEQKKELLKNLKSLVKESDKIINKLLNDEHNTSSELGHRYHLKIYMLNFYIEFGKF